MADGGRGEGMPEGPVLMNSNELRWWYERVNQLELKMESMDRQLRQKGSELRSTAKQLKDQQAWNQTLMKQLSAERKAKKELEETIKEMGDKTDDEVQKLQRSEKDRKDLCRTINRLHDRINQLESERDYQEKQVKALDESRAAAEERNDSFRRSLRGMGELHHSLEEQLRREREKRGELKTQVRAKMDRLQSDHAVMADKVNRHDEIVQEWQGQYEESQRQVFALQAEIEKSRREAHQMSIEVEDRIAEKEDIHRQLRDLQQFNEQLSTDLRACRDRLFAVEQRWKSDQQNWRTKHIQHLDQLLEERPASPPIPHPCPTVPHTDSRARSAPPVRVLDEGDMEGERVVHGAGSPRLPSPRPYWVRGGIVTRPRHDQDGEWVRPAAPFA